MRKLLTLTVILGLFINAFAASLVYQSMEEITSLQANSWAKIGAFDASRYKQIRIVVKKKNPDKVKKDKFKGYRVISVKNNQEIPIKLDKDFSSVINEPSAPIKIEVNENGTFWVYAYSVP